MDDPLGLKSSSNILLIIFCYKKTFCRCLWYANFAQILIKKYILIIHFYTLILNCKCFNVLLNVLFSQQYIALLVDIIGFSFNMLEPISQFTNDIGFFICEFSIRSLLPGTYLPQITRAACKNNI